MRMWSMHPRYLDRQGLLACWREGLLAQAVLREETKGYRNHPQLDRFKAHPEPLVAIGTYLHHIALEAAARGYTFNVAKARGWVDLAELAPVPVTQGQVEYEFGHLKAKLAVRDPERLSALPAAIDLSVLHPLLELMPGGIEPWEKVS